MKGSIRLCDPEEYDTEAMLDFLKKNCIDCRPGRAQEIADVVHGFGFTMGRWYHDRWDVSFYDYMYRAGNEIHLGGPQGEVTDFEDFLERFYVGPKEPLNSDFSSLFEQFYQQ